MDWKKTVKNVIFVVLAGGFLFYVMMIATVFAMLSGTPLHWVQGIDAAAAILFACWALSLFADKKSKVRRVFRWLMIAGLLCCTVYVGHGIYVDSLPTVGERQYMLYEYAPFEEGTKAAVLSENRQASLRMEDKLPSLDGATALYPVYAAFVQAVYPERKYELYGGEVDDNYGLVSCSGTTEAYERLINGSVDVIFAAGPSADQRQAAENAGVELKLTPIGKEAFVFFVNRRNPVEGLSISELRGIYSGEIVNWSEVGGKNQEIRAFQRAENSGSQTALQNMMGDTPLMEPPTEERIGAMEGIVRAVSDYRNFKDALGFSFRFYSMEMVKNDEIRLLAVDGVNPEAETIRDGSYPLSSEFYAVTAGEGSQQTRELIDWILSAEGQELIEKTGYVPVS